METPKYISTLLQPTASKPTGRRVWSIDLEMVWVPFFTATNTVQATAIPHEALGAPLRLAKTSDGEVKFTKSGRPSLKVATELAAQIRIVRENFVASLQSFTGRVVTQAKDAYKAEVEAAHKAAAPILAQMTEDLTLATLPQKGQVKAETEAGETAAPQPEADKVAA